MAETAETVETAETAEPAEQLHAGVVMAVFTPCM